MATNRAYKCKHRGCDFKCRKMTLMRSHYLEFPKHHPRGGKSLRQVEEEKRKRKARNRKRSIPSGSVTLPTRKRTVRARVTLPFCTDCGIRTKLGWKFCGRCGTKLIRSAV